MRTLKRFSLALLAAAFVSLANGQINSQSDGSDQALTVAPNQNKVIDLNLAITGNGLTTPGQGNGVYDPVRWAVVFKWTSVDIGAGATVTFINNKSNAPVIWLCQGSATINGTIDIRGNDATNTSLRAAGGPGGFAGGLSDTWGANPGQGYGGGSGNYTGGSFATLGLNDSQGRYGTTDLLPLIGGSGGGRAGGGNGGGGGGAILICANTSIVVASTGSIDARGGAGSNAGAGGGVRLVSNQLNISGKVYAFGPNSQGGNGYNRFEGNTVNANGADINPVASVIQGISNNPLIFPDNLAPTCTIQSIAGFAVGTDPSGNPVLPDLTVTTGGNVEVVIATTNVPQSWTVTVRVVTAGKEPATYTNAVFDVPGRWKATVNLPDGGSVLVVRAAAPGSPG